MKKVVLVTNILNPYRLPLFNELNSQLKAEDIAFKVIVGASGYDWRKFKIDLSQCTFEYEILPSKSIALQHEEIRIFNYKNLLKILRKEKPDTIIVSGFSPATVKAWWHSLFRKTKLIIWSGSVARAGERPSFIRSLQRKFLAGKASAFIAYGSRAASYLENLGVKKEKIFIGINTVDTDYFRSETARLKTHVVDAKLKHLTCVTYLNKRKNIDRVIDSIRILAAKRNDFVLDIIGEGDERVNLEKKVAENKLDSVVKFHGFKQKDELPEFYAKSSCFLFQTDFDIWGLVLNEAMAAGLTCIASPNAGAVDDLLKNNDTGFIINFEEAQNVADVLKTILDDPAKANMIGAKASEFISNHATIAISAKGFVKAVKAVTI